MNTHARLIVASLVLPLSLAFFDHASPAARAADAASDVVARIMRADYEGDRSALRRLSEEVAALLGSATPRRQALGRYWRGYALLRSAQNGVNDGVDPAELVREFQSALDHFEAAVAADSTFSEPRFGILQSLQALAFLNRNDSPALQAVLPRLQHAVEQAKPHADNPRIAWVLGAQDWYGSPGTAPAEIERKQAAAIARYLEALPAARAQRTAVRDTVEPSWGEPELLMSLAWAYANKTSPDIAAAQRYANEALAIVPHWHYLRDILIPQIEAKAKSR